MNIHDTFEADQPVMVVVVCSELTWPEIGRVFCSYRKFNLNTVCRRDNIKITIDAAQYFGWSTVISEVRSDESRRFYF